MYPFITLWWRHIEMTGLGFVIWFIVFCWICFLWTRRKNLSFFELFYSLPFMIGIIYFLWSYSNFLLNTHQLLPYNITELAHLIIPPSYAFHAGWLCIGIVVSLLIFLYKQNSKSTKKKRIDIIFSWYMYSIIVLWLFLVLWDDMIGLSTDSRLWIYSMTPYSEVTKFNQVLPVGLFLSIASGLSLLGGKFLQKKYTTIWRWIWGFAIFFFLLSIVLVFQQHPKHLSIDIGPLTLDINQYITRILAILCSLSYISSIKKAQKNIVRIR